MEVGCLWRLGGALGQAMLLFNVSKLRETSFETSWQAFRILSVTQQGTGYTMMTVKRRALFCICNEHIQWFLYTLHTLPMHFPFVTHLSEILSLTQQLTMAIFVQGRKSANGWRLLFSLNFLSAQANLMQVFMNIFISWMTSNNNCRGAWRKASNVFW